MDEAHGHSLYLLRRRDYQKTPPGEPPEPCQAWIHFSYAFHARKEPKPHGDINPSRADFNEAFQMTSIHSIRRDPSCPKQLTYHVHLVGSEVFNLESETITQLHCPIFNDNEKEICPSYMKRPAWMSEKLIYDVGDCNQKIHLVNFSPKKSSEKSVILTNERFNPTSEYVVSCVVHPNMDNIIAGSRGDINPSRANFNEAFQTTSIHSIRRDPSCPKQLVFHVHLEGSGVFNIDSKTITQLHCPIFNYKAKEICLYMRRPVWMPRNSLYAVGNRNQGIHLVYFSPRKSRVIFNPSWADFSEAFQTTSIHSIRRDPSYPKQLTFYVHLGGSGVFNLYSITQMHCPIFNDKKKNYPFYIRRPAWIPRNLFYVVGNRNQGIHLVDFSPKKSLCHWES